MIEINFLIPLHRDFRAYQAGEFRDLSFAEYRGKWLVLFFYPRDFTFICPTELKGFAAEETKFKELGAEIVAASVDSEWCHKAWFERDLSMVKFPVIADTSLELSSHFGVLNKSNGSAERGLFIIDPASVVKYALVSSGSVGRSVKETLRVLKALQTGELCPLGWEPGMETLGKAA